MTTYATATGTVLEEMPAAAPRLYALVSTLDTGHGVFVCEAPSLSAANRIAVQFLKQHRPRAVDEILKDYPGSDDQQIIDHFTYEGYLGLSEWFFVKAVSGEEDIL